MSEVTKYCPRCEISKPATNEHFASGKNKDGFHSYCRPCTNALGKEQYHKRAKKLPPGEAARRVMAIDVNLFPPAAPGESIGCLRCRHAQLHFDTDFSPGNTRPLILCERENKVREICWHSCPVADPRLSKPRHLHKYTARWGALGDKLGHASPLTIAFLRAYWTTAPAEQLEKATGWTMFKLTSMVRYYKIGGSHTSNNRLHLIGKKQNERFSQRQTAWLLREYSSPDWPGPLVYCLKQDEYERRLAQQREIVRTVRALNPQGPKWTWQQIQRHIGKRLRTQHDQKQKQRRGELRKVNQHVAIPIRTVTS
jgi:hypothetical protein